MGDMRETPGPILCVVGARPNYMKMAPLMRAFAANPALPRAILVHTGQHYDVAMNDRLFTDLRLPAPDVNLEVGSGTHAVQTAEIMKRFEPVVDDFRPSCVVVVGDVNSTMACSLVAVKKAVKVVHVEGGLRSFDRAMPEEINRLVTDQLADLLYTTERSAADNLAREGIGSERIVFAGNVMIDSLLANRERAVPPAETLARAGVDAGLAAETFAFVTLHRPSNVDSPEALVEVLTTLRDASERLPLVCPLHPRTQGNIRKFGLESLVASPRIAILPPQGYLEALGLLAKATIVLTDSGGIQEETTALGVPCLTMRENTERPITVEQGTNTLVGRDRALTLRLLDETLATGGKRGRMPEFWDGHAAERIASHLGRWLVAQGATAKA
ncbi:MAG: UDP-N-acetylglucosamine 2-epimerase (non-hydrolyzing) [Burkholderiales bacterium]|jgi:UDP-N-acetylglucosamine 2-epimerase (non-hydrolysing)|nr:UDP-N-acetylglucosamine 2-epimerase (non-hydrolyzing) [Burkholderiales bacterium]